MRKVLAGTICVAAMIPLTACGSAGSKPSDSDRATAAFTQELITQSAASTAGALKFNSTQARCTASQVVSTVGVSKLQSYGLLDSKLEATSKTLDKVTLTRTDATSIVNAIIGCLGEATFTKTLSDAVTSSITGADKAAQRDCLQRKLTVAALKPMLIDTLSGDTQAATQFYAGLLDCTKH